MNFSDQTIRNRPHEGGLRTRHSLLCLLPSAVEPDWHFQKNNNWQLHHSCFSQTNRFTLSTCDICKRVTGRSKEECYAACNIAQHDQFFGGSVAVWGGISHRPLLARQGSLTFIKHQDENLGPIVRPCAGAGVSGFLMVPNNAQLHVRVWWQFLSLKELIDLPLCLPVLNPVQHLSSHLEHQCCQSCI